MGKTLPLKLRTFAIFQSLSENEKPIKVNMVTPSCPKNRVKSEVLLTRLKGNGIDATHESAKIQSNIVIIKYMQFFDNAKQESIYTILRYVDAKQERVWLKKCMCPVASLS